MKTLEKIENKVSFEELVKELVFQIKNKEIQQITNNSDPFCTKKDLLQMHEENSYPDYLRCYFQDIKTKKSLFIIN